MQREDHEDELLRSVTLKNAQSILLARQRAEEELLRAKNSLELKSRQLAQSLAMIRATLESTTDGILVTDGSGNVSEISAKYMEMWGILRDATERGDDCDILELTSRHFADPRAFLARIEEIRAASPTETHDLLETLDHRFIERFSRIQFIEGRNVGRVWSFHDISARRRASEALRDETRMLELLNRTGTTMAAQLELPTLVQSVTDAATQLAGAQFGAFFYNVLDERGETFLLYTLSGAPREAFERFGIPRNTPVFDPTFRATGVVRSVDITKDPRYGQMEPHHGMPEGHLPVRSYLAVPVVSRSGKPIGGLFFGHSATGVFTEKTERMIVGFASQAAIAIDNARLYEDVKRLADEREVLLDAERAARAAAQYESLLKDEFFANISHELRTPLNAILGWSQILATGRASQDDLRLGIETIARNAKAQSQLIEDLLDMSRIISGKVRLDMQELDLAAIVRQALNTVRPSAEAKHIQLRQSLDPVTGPVTGDPGRLQQVVWNLLSNAVKFTPMGGKVEIAVHRLGTQLELAVRDNGVGILREFLPHVFDRFRQADSSSARSYGGLGLGLTIVKQIVELHGGTVRAESQGEGKGALFVVRLPIATTRPAECCPEFPGEPALASDCDGVDLAGIRVLVVEDEADARELLLRVLEHCHAEVLTAPNAVVALEILGSRSVHVIVSDIGMPEIDGYQFIRQVRCWDAAKGGKTPAIALTAFARSEDRTRAMIAGYQSHLSKPVEPRELIAAVASLADRVRKDS